MAEYFINRQSIKLQVGEFVKISNRQKISKLIFLIKLIAVYLLLFIVFYFTHWLVSNQRLNYLLCGLPFFIVFVGCLQYIIAQAAHEAIHFYIGYKDKSWSAIICSWLVLYPIGITKNYKKSHMLHHTHFGDAENDPDLVTFMNYPTSKFNFWLWLIEGFLGLSTAKRIINIVLETKKKQPKKLVREDLRFEFIKLLAMQTIILFILISLGLWWSYFILWILPLAVFTKMLINIRLLAEHSPFTSAEPALRSFLKKDWSTNLLGIFGFKYHAEHHLFPGVLSTHLESISKIIAKQATINRHSPDDIKIEIFDMSYLQFLKRFYSSLPTYKLRNCNDGPLSM